MLTYTFKQTYYDCLYNASLFIDIEDELTDALIQSDFGEEEVELRFADFTMYKNAIKMFSMIAQKMGYIIRFIRANEIHIYGDVPNQVCRYLFMNSIPENADFPLNNK